jgi:hypothetical protein
MIRRIALLSALVALGLATTGSSARGSVTLGQTFAPDVDWAGAGTIIQTTSPGNSYVVPSNGVITSWSFEASADQVGPMKVKIVRPAGGDDFTTVGESSLETPSLGTLNTWPTQISVKTGDLLGEYYDSSTFPLRADSSYHTNEISAGSPSPAVDPPPGTTTNYPPSSGDYQIDLSVVLEPDNSFTFAAITRNQKKGTATITVNDIPNPGDLTGSGSGANVSSARALTSKSVGAGSAQLLIKAKGKKKKKLNQKGKVKLNVAVTYTPTGGSPNTQSVKVKLKKKLRR